MLTYASGVAAARELGEQADDETIVESSGVTGNRTKVCCTS